jgi:hypothetical protein
MSSISNAPIAPRPGTPGGERPELRLEELDLSRFSEVPDPVILAPVPPRAAPPVVASPTRAAMRTRKLMALGLTLAWFVVLLLVFGTSTSMTMMSLSLYAVVPALFGALALAIALRSGSSGLGSKSRTFQVTTLLFPVLLVLVVLLGPRIEHDGFSRAAFVCGDIILLLGVVPLMTAMYALRRFCVTGAVWRSALVGLGIGLVTASVNALHCSNVDAMHVAVGHFWPVPVFVLFATVVLRRFAAVK